MRATRTLIGLLLTTMLPAHLPARTGCEYSATVVESDADGRMANQIRIFVGPDGMRRAEAFLNGHPTIQIILPERGVMWVLFPDQNTYVEHHGVGSAPAAEAEPENPCAGQAEFSCTLLGEEVIDGRSAKKWEITARSGEDHLHALEWVDIERSLPLRLQRHDGSIIEMRLLGTEECSGRMAEKWLTRIIPPEGRGGVQRSLQWYDPQLQTVLCQALPDGSMRRLRNVRVASQPRELFTLPKGYRNVRSRQPDSVTVPERVSYSVIEKKSMELSKERF